MAQQFIEIAEQVTRGTIVGDEVWYPLPVRGGLKPAFAPTDEPRKEFRGADTGQGDSTVFRKESAWSHTIECAWYPIAAVGLLWKHLLGDANTRAVVDTSGYKGLVLPANLPFGTGALLADKAIAIRVNYDNGEGVTKSKIYHGGRLTKATIKGAGSDDVLLSFDLGGPGDYITAEGAGTTPPDFSTLPAPFSASDALLYIGAGATRTGTAPDYTEIGPGTMQQFIPDSFDLTIETGRKDKTVMDGVRGPNRTVKEGQIAVTASFPVDIRDPSSGFSSHDEIELLFAGVREQPVMIVFSHDALAGAATEKYGATIDLPRMALKAPKEEYNTEGKTPTAALEMFHLYSDTTKYAMALETVDKLAAY